MRSGRVIIQVGGCGNPLDRASYAVAQEKLTREYGVAVDEVGVLDFAATEALQKKISSMLS